jgi:serine O-acetyltransferase
MATDIRLKDELPAITDQLVETYTECSRLNHLAHEPLPSRDAVADIAADLYEVMYPGDGRACTSGTSATTSAASWTRYTTS